MQIMETSLRRAVPDGAQNFAGSEQAGADGANGDVENSSQFGVRLPFHFPQPQQSTLLLWNPL
jgi:hypothetical protein